MASAKHTEDSTAITRTRRFFQFRRAPGIMFLDYDPPKPISECSETNPPKPTKPTIGPESISPADLIATLRAVAPCLADAPMLWRPSASSGIVHATTGEPLTGLAGQRIYIPVADAALIPDAGKALVTLLWAAGYGRIEIGAAGQALERTLVDASVWQPERLDFAAPPSLGPGLRREPQAAFIDGEQGELCDLRRLIDAADGTIKAQAATARKIAKAAARPAIAAAQAAWIDVEAPVLVQHGIPLDVARAVLARACDVHDLTGEFRLQCPDGTTTTVGDLLDNPAKWHGKRFADPLEPNYGQDPRIAWANLRSGGRPYLHSHAHGGRKFRLVRPSARIRLAVGERARVLDNLLDLLRTRAELYDHGEGSALARITEDARALPASREWLTDHLDRTAQFYSEKVDGQNEDKTAKIIQVTHDAPAWAAMRIIAKDGERGLPKLDAVISAPTLRADGSVLSEPGYDSASRLLLLADAPDIPHIPDAPTISQVRAALELLWSPVALFPLVDSVDRGVILAALLTAVVRASIPTAPGFALDAPTAGTGKTLLAEVIGALSLGYAPTVFSPISSDDEETRKLLFAALRDGQRVLIWDNIREPLGNGTLDAFLTAPTFSGRILQTSSTATLPNRALFLATGNNLVLKGDTCRRLFPVRLDARIERPYARMFDFDPLQVVLARRLEFVTAALTIMRGWIAAGRPRHGAGRSASFGDWDNLVRQTVCWVGTLDQRFADPLKATDRAYEIDPETTKLSALLSAWSDAVGTMATTTGHLITLAMSGDRVRQQISQQKAMQREEVVASLIAEEQRVEALRDAVEEIAGNPRGDINRRSLGRWIESHLERRHAGARLTRGKLSAGSQTWLLAHDKPAAQSGPMVGLVGLGGFVSEHGELPATAAADVIEVEA
ncbi:hypothetical protein [uncultured Thiodictyon sp.]|uniref:hypothetical protein n=1 Tax=uncultured Thiodictyon sp. TaxID=1846217 RepID=UPI0025E256C7|nr:hypothetical protein [uncultured Thiodictyon sp.]